MKKCTLTTLIILINLFFNIIFISASVEDKLDKLKNLYKKRNYVQAVNLIETDNELLDALEDTNHSDKILINPIFSNKDKEVSNRINYLYLIARSYHQAKIYSKAIDYYFLVSQNETVLSDYALFHLAECYQIMNKYHYAIYYYNLLTEKYPSSFYYNESFLNIIECYEKTFKHQEAIVKTNELLEKAPRWNTSSLLLKKAHLHELSGSWTEALLTYQKIVSDYSKSKDVPTALLRIEYLESRYPNYKFKITAEQIWDRGMAYYFAREYRESITQFKKIIDNKMSVELEDDCYNMIGKAFYKRYSFWKAIEYFKIATQKYPDKETYVDSLFELANSYMRVKNGDSAIWIYKKIDMEFSNSGYGDNSLLKIAQYYEAIKKTSKSMEVYLELVDKYPETTYKVDIYWSIAHMHLQQNNLDEAIKYFDLLYNNFPSSPYSVEAFFWSGKCYEKTSNWQQAVTVYKKILTTSYNKNFFYFRAKERLTWINSNKYICLSDEEKNNLYALAISHYEKKQYADAIENFRKIIYLYDNTDLAYKSFQMVETCYAELKIWPEIFNSNNNDSGDIYVSSLVEKYNKNGNSKAKHLKTIKELLNLGLFDEGSTEIDKLRIIDYKDVDLLYLQIVANKESQQYYKAIAAAENLIRLIIDKENRAYLKDELFLPIQLKKFLYPDYYYEYIEKYAKDYNIDPYFALAVIREESRFKEYARSRSYALGLMQIIPSTGRFIAQNIGMKKFSNELLHDSETNIKMGVWYLKHLSDEFQNNKFFILAAYNGGPNNVKKWLKKCNDTNDMDEFVSKIGFNETHNYIKKVMNSYNRYKEIYALATP